MNQVLLDNPFSKKSESKIIDDFRDYIKNLSVLSVSSSDLKIFADIKNELENKVIDILHNKNNNSGEERIKTLYKLLKSVNVSDNEKSNHYDNSWKRAASVFFSFTKNKIPIKVSIYIHDIESDLESCSFKLSFGYTKNMNTKEISNDKIKNKVLIKNNKDTKKCKSKRNKKKYEEDEDDDESADDDYDSDSDNDIYDEGDDDMCEDDYESKYDNNKKDDDGYNKDINKYLDDDENPEYSDFDDNEEDKKVVIHDYKRVFTFDGTTSSKNWTANKCVDLDNARLFIHNTEFFDPKSDKIVIYKFLKDFLSAVLSKLDKKLGSGGCDYKHVLNLKILNKIFS